MLCMETCAQHCIVVDEELNSRGFHPMKYSESQRCTGCRMCALMCPDVCITVYRESRTPKESR